MRLKATALLAFATIATVSAQSPTSSGYLTPPKAIADIMLAEPLPTAVIGPGRDVIALMSRSSMPPIADVSAPMLRLAGLRINPRTNGPHLGGNLTGITLRTLSTGAEKKVAVPAGARLGTVIFSPD